MGEVVAGIGLPHAPGSPAAALKEGPDGHTAQLYRPIAEHLEAVRPDALVIFSNDHFNTFFLDNFPTFAIGVAERSFGPNDYTPMPAYKVPLHAALGEQIRARAIEGGFDLTLTQEFGLDHSFMVPLHFLVPHMRIPIIPIFVNGFIRPLPLARRCHALGQAIRAAVESFPAKLRVAVIGSGSMSLEIGGPLIRPGQRNGVPDPDWVTRVQGHLENVRIGQLLDEATGERMWKAGNAGGELLNWIAMLGAIGDRKPTYIEPQLAHGDMFAVWRWD